MAALPTAPRVMRTYEATGVAAADLLAAMSASFPVITATNRITLIALPALAACINRHLTPPVERDAKGMPVKTDDDTAVSALFGVLGTGLNVAALGLAAIGDGQLTRAVTPMFDPLTPTKILKDFADFKASGGTVNNATRMQDALDTYNRASQLRGWGGMCLMLSAYWDVQTLVMTWSSRNPKYTRTWRALKGVSACASGVAAAMCIFDPFQQDSPKLL